MQCTEESLQALEDVDGAATAAEHKATSNFLEACLLLRLVRGRSTLSDGLGALAALAEDRAAAKLAVERVGLDARLVALDLEGSGEASGSDRTKRFFVALLKLGYDIKPFTYFDNLRCRQQ